MIIFKEITMFSTNELFRITFNTAFIGENNQLSFSRMEISPEDV